MADAEAEEYSEDVPGTDPDQLISPSLLDGCEDVGGTEDNHDEHDQPHPPAGPPRGTGNSEEQVPPSAPPPLPYSPSRSQSTSLSGSQRSQILFGGSSEQASPALLVDNADMPSAQNHHEHDESQPSSEPVPVTDHKPTRLKSADGGEAGIKEEDHESDADNENNNNHNRDDDPATRRAAELESFNNSWPAFQTNLQKYPLYGASGSYRIPEEIANLLGPPHQLDFEEERELWERDLKRRKALIAQGINPGMEQVQARLRADEKFWRDGGLMQERHERWRKGEYSDDDENGGHCHDGNAKLRERLRKAGPPPTIAELAVLMGLRPAPPVKKDDENIVDEDATTEKKQTLLAPLPDRNPTGWQSAKKMGQKRSQPTSSSRPTAYAAATTTTSSLHAFPDVDASSRSRSEPRNGHTSKPKSRKGKGSDFFNKKRKRHRILTQMTAQSDDEADPHMDPFDSGTLGAAVGASRASSGRGGGRSGKRMFQCTPGRANASLTQTSLLDKFDRK